MKIELINEPEQTLIDFLDDKIVEFNWQNRELNERRPIAVKLNDAEGNVIAGAAGETFGHWLLIKTLWVSEDLRGQNIGQELLAQIEKGALARNCKYSLLDTLNFQAMPFYKKYGYIVQWQQENYPLTGSKYFMVKTLVS